MLLRDMKPGEKGVIKAFRHGLIEYRKRLLALGALPGTPFVVERVSLSVQPDLSNSAASPPASAGGRNSSI